MDELSEIVGKKCEKERKKGEKKVLDYDYLYPLLAEASEE